MILSDKKMANLKISRFEEIIKKSICILLFMGLVVLAIDPKITNKLINISGMLSFIVFLINIKNANCKGKASWLVLAAMLVLGALDLLYYITYKHSGAIYINAYRGYLETGKMAVFGAFTFFVLNSGKCTLSRRFFFWSSIFAQIFIISRAFYQSIYLSYSRIPLSAMGGVENASGAATVAAYMIVFCGIYSAVVFLKSDIKHNLILTLVSTLLTLASVVMTGTRSAMIAFPIAVIVMFIIEYRHNSLHLTKVLCSVVAIFLMCGVLFQSQLQTRLKQLESDLASYSRDNSNTSVGARLAMIKAGFESTDKYYLWQSLEVRAQKIRALAAKDHSLSGATGYLNVHMHNEFSEAISSKGILGVLAVFFIYASIFAYAYVMRQSMIVVLLIPLVILGFSDVLMHAKPIPASWILSLILLCSYLNINSKISNE